MRLFRIGIVLLGLSAGPMSAEARPALSCTEDGDVAAAVCNESVLRDLDIALMQTESDYRTQIGKRPGRLRQFDTTSARWRLRDRATCGVDNSCLASQYFKRLNRLRQDLDRPPLVWQLFEGDRIRLADRRPLGSIPDLPKGGIPENLSGLLGAWRGAFSCPGAAARMELVFVPGYGGRINGFHGAWETGKDPLDAIARNQFAVLPTGEPGTFVLDGRNSRIDRHGPRLTSVDQKVTLSKDGRTLTGNYVASRCGPFTLERVKASETLEALMAAAARTPNYRWSWPYDPANVPFAGDHQFCRSVLKWADGFLDHYPPGDRHIGDTQLMSVAMLEDPALPTLLGAPFDEVPEAQRKAFLDRLRSTCLNNPLIGSAFQVHDLGIMSVLRAQRDTAHYRGILSTLQEVRAARGWMAKTVAAVGKDPVAAETYTAAHGALNAVETRLKMVLPGEVRSFEAAMAAARKEAAPAFALKRIEEVPSGKGTETLAALQIAQVNLKPVLELLDEEQRSVLLNVARDRETQILREQMPAAIAKLEQLGAGLAAVEAGRAWHVAFRLDFGAYLNHADVRPVMAAFVEARTALVSSVAAELADAIKATKTEAELVSLGERYLLPDIDRAVASVAAALEAKEDAFARDRLLAGYSPYEKSLADAGGTLAVPADYPEPTDEEIKLAMSREYGQYGKQNFDGSFDYGLFPEASVNMRVVGISKDGCGEKGAGYTCRIRINLRMEMSRAMRGALGNSFQGQFMESMLDQANSTSVETTEHDFVLTPGGWRSPSLATIAARGIQNSMNTLVEVGTGVGCALSDLDC